MMPDRKGLVAVLVITGLGVLSSAAWLGEVVLLKGWDGLRWLEGYPSASFVGVACVALSVLVPIHVKHRISVGRASLFVAIAFAIGWFSFDLARSCLYELHSPSAAFMALSMDPSMAWHFTFRNLAGLASAALLSAVGFTVAVRLFLARVSWWMAGLFLAAIALVMPVSMLTILVVPALNGKTDYLYVVKMGYPLFWTNILMGLVGWLGVRGSLRGAVGTEPPRDFRRPG